VGSAIGVGVREEMGLTTQRKMEGARGMGEPSLANGMGLERATSEGSSSVAGGMGLERATAEVLRVGTVMETPWGIQRANGDCFLQERIQTGVTY
jgi:hypothetical protein